MNLAVFGAYFLSALVSVIYSLLKLCKLGISKESRKIVIVRYML